MSLKVNEQYLQSFIDAHEREYLLPYIEVAHDMLHAKKGAGNDFLGWVDLPLNYDKEEYARIKAAAQKIIKQSSVLVVIGIGGSYLGARAAIEFINSPLYNSKKKDMVSLTDAMSLMLPYTIAFSILWLLIIIAFSIIGLPLGFGAGVML